MKVAVYIRVSTKRQVEDGYSLDAQKERLTRWCEINNYTIYKIYADEGKSGKNTNRPAFQEMMDDLELGLFNKILVLKLDRISRSITDLEKLFIKLKEKNVDFESATEKIDTNSSFGMMFTRILGIFAQFERERISERILDAQQEMVLQGRPLSGNMAYGYKIVNKELTISEENANVVRFIFESYIKNQSQRKVLLELLSKYNIKMSMRTVSRILKNTIYIGEYRNNTNYCKPIIDKETFDKANNILSTRNIKESPTRRIYLFSGLLIDKNCGHRLTSAYCRGNYYTCREHSTHKNCITKSIVNEKKLEKKLLSELEDTFKETLKTKNIEYDNKKIIDYSSKILELKEELNRLNELYLKQRIDSNSYEKKYDFITKKIQEYNSKPKTSNSANLSALFKPFWQEYYNILNQEEKRVFWRNIIDRIEINPNNYLNEKLSIYFLD